eukprot:595911_1
MRKCKDSLKPYIKRKRGRGVYITIYMEYMQIMYTPNQVPSATQSKWWKQTTNEVKRRQKRRDHYRVDIANQERGCRWRPFRKALEDDNKYIQPLKTKKK